ncbi:unnamed protein product [Symbiodinium microadriaticum]|nr:unnamed protein product [Symbiodinium microadriaticum]
MAALRCSPLLASSFRSSLESQVQMHATLRKPLWMHTTPAWATHPFRSLSTQRTWSCVLNNEGC